MFYNSSHYVAWNLERFEDAPVLTGQTLMYQGKYGMTYTIWTPWRQTPCPPFWDCKGFDRANLWECWETPEWERVCWPVADKQVPGTYLQPLNAGNLDAGATFIYEGQYNVNMEIFATCDPSSRPDYLDIETGPVVYQASMNGPEWVFTAGTHRACPRPWATPGTPVMERGLPHPSRQEWSNYWGIPGTDLQFGLDIKNLTGGQISVVVENADVDHFYKAQIYYSPWKLSSCPEGKNCSIFAAEGANIWICLEATGEGAADLNFTECYPGGDARYDVWVEAVNMENHTHGVRAVYGGGVLNASQGMYGVVVLWCSENLSEGMVEWVRLPTRTGASDLGLARQSGLNFTLYGQTRGVCPRPVPAAMGEGRGMGGAVFLCVVLGVFVVYFAVGGFVAWFRTGTPVPNVGFWGAVASSVMATIRWVMGCGGAQGGLSYDRL
jgi:hypothetical protein